MLQTSELLETGIYTEENVDSNNTNKTLQDYIDSLDIDGIKCAVLVNGKRQEMNYILKKDDKIIVIPEIKGGF